MNQQSMPDFLFGTGFQEMPTMNPQQLQILQQILSQLGKGGNLGQGYDESITGMREMLDPSSAAMQRFEAPYLQQFNEQTVPQLGERFAGQGAQSGALSSSGFGQALSSAGSGLQTQLAGMKSGLQQQAMRDLMNQFSTMSGQGMGAQPFGVASPQEGFLPQMIMAFMQNMGKGAGAAAGAG